MVNHSVAENQVTFDGSAIRKKVSVKGISTAFLDVGSGEAIIALHGIPTSSALFEPLLPRLSSYRFIAPDLLGQGDTETPLYGLLGYTAYADHLSSFLDAVAPTTFHLLLHDFGGVLGLDWASDHVNRVASIVILSTTVTWSIRVGGLLYAANLIFGKALIQRGIGVTLKRRKTLESSLTESWARPWSRRRLLRGLDHFAPAHLRRVRSKLQSLHMPVLLIWGEQDNIFPRVHAMSIIKELPQARLVTIPRCGHWSPLDAPEEVAQHIVTFSSEFPEFLQFPHKELKGPEGAQP